MMSRKYSELWYQTYQTSNLCTTTLHYMTWTSYLISFYLNFIICNMVVISLIHMHAMWHPVKLAELLTVLNKVMSGYLEGP